MRGGGHWAGMRVAVSLPSKRRASFCFSYKNIYRELEQSLKAADAVEDLRWFRANHGPGMSMNWPQFEVGGGCARTPWPGHGSNHALSFSFQLHAGLCPAIEAAVTPADV